MRTLARLAAAALFTFASAQASAQCAGFTDTSAGPPFCDSIQWIKNRGITLGCGVDVFCPTANVTREQMAAFMNRLGKALTPEILYAQADTGPITLLPSAFTPFCTTGDSVVQVAPVQWPRQANVTGMLSGLSDGTDAGWNLFPLVSTDGGTTWNNLNGATSVGMRATAKANLWAVASVNERMDLLPCVTYRFTLGIRRDNATATAGNLSQGRCQLAAAINNRNPSSPPF